MEILVIEDNSADVYLLKEFFSEHQDAPEIYAVVDGEEALDYVFQRNQHQNARRPDIILLDLGLPQTDGYEVLKQLKASPLSASIPVVVLTTSRNPVDHNACNTLGADIFLSKPRTHEEFSKTVQLLLRWAGLHLANAPANPSVN